MSVQKKRYLLICKTISMWLWAGLYFIVSEVIFSTLQPSNSFSNVLLLLVFRAGSWWLTSFSHCFDSTLQFQQTLYTCTQKGFSLQTLTLHHGKPLHLVTSSMIVWDTGEILSSLGLFSLSDTYCLPWPQWCTFLSIPAPPPQS